MLHNSYETLMMHLEQNMNTVKSILEVIVEEAKQEVEILKKNHSNCCEIAYAFLTLFF